MPTIADMMEVADLFQVDNFRIELAHCTAVRNRNSKCRKCADICIENAITVENNSVTIDGGKCVNCGACVAVCPTNCIAPLNPTVQKLEAGAVKTANASKTACLACARKAAKHEADPDLFFEVPCLAHVSEYGLLDIAAADVADIALVDGCCETCKYGKANDAINTTVHEAEKLIECVDGSVKITRSSEFPPHLAGTFKRNVRGSDRRGLMRQTGQYFATVAGKVADKTVQEKLGIGSDANQPFDLKSRLKVGLGGKMPTFVPEANMQLLDNMLALSQRGGSLDSDSSVNTATSPVHADTLETRRFGNVSINPDECSGCGMCVLFCPTAALKYAQYDEPDDPDMRYLEFQVADCTQCNMCKDVCLRGCIDVSGEVDTAELFDFEPRLLAIPRPQDKLDYFKRQRR